jgi:hypothetical protein
LRVVKWKVQQMSQQDGFALPHRAKCTPRRTEAEQLCDERSLLACVQRLKALFILHMCGIAEAML